MRESQTCMTELWPTFLSQNPKDGLPNICLGREKEKNSPTGNSEKREKSMQGL